MELVDIGEGVNGNYNEDDAEDMPLLRFYVSRQEDGEWQEVASYCTNLSSEINDDTQQTALVYLMDRFYEPVKEGQSIKRLAEEMSWMEERWFTESPAPVLQ